MNIMDKIPKGYLYCKQCELFTRHEKVNKWGGVACAVCTAIEYGERCDNCGYAFDDEIPIEGPREVTVHGEGCHFNDWYLDWFSSWRPTYADYLLHTMPVELVSLLPDNLKKCGCQKEVVYEVPAMENYKEWEGDTMTCVNAREWSYDMRCPICGHLTHFRDGNC